MRPAASKRSLSERHGFRDRSSFGTHSLRDSTVFGVYQVDDIQRIELIDLHRLGIALFCEAGIPHGRLSVD